MSVLWRILASCGVAALAAGLAAITDAKPWITVIGASIGGLGTAFAPTLWEHWKGKQAALEAVLGITEILPEGPATLLHPSRAIVPFIGRERELTELLEWCSDPHAERLKLLVGSGGVGKSRLAFELAARLGDAWGFVQIRDDAEMHALSKWREVSTEHVLILVDYAETRTDLAALLHEVAGDANRHVRMLLLARSAGEWWRYLGAQSARVRQMVTAAGDGMLLKREVQHNITAHHVLAQAIPHFATALSRPIPDKVTMVLRKGPQRILDLHAAALVAVLQSDSLAKVEPEGISLEISDVLEELLGHERRYWIQSAQVRGLLSGPYGLSFTTVEQTVAVGTLLGAKDRIQAGEVVGRVPDGAATVLVADWLRELYPADQSDNREWLGKIQPDRLAELHITRQLASSPELLASCMKDLEPRQLKRALVTLARAAHELTDAAEILRQLLPDISNIVGPAAASRDILAAIHEALPHPSTTLAEGSALLAQQILASTTSNSDMGERARWLAAASLHLGDLDRFAEAIPFAEEAVALLRQLGDRYRPALAIALSNLGIYLSELGQYSDALATAREAVLIYRQLAEQYLEDSLPGLGRALNNLGIRLSAVNNLAEALAVGEEAVAIYRQLAGQYPEQYRPDLGRSLSTLGVRLSLLGRSPEALAVTEEAVTIYRQLADRYPDRYCFDLATALSNLGVWYVELGCPDEALPIAEEALAIRYGIAERHPDRARSGLATALSNLGVCLMQLGRHADALSVEQKAIDIRRELAEGCFDRHAPDLGRSLTNISNTLSALGYHDRALSVAEESAKIYRTLAERHSFKHEPDHGFALVNLSARLLMLDRTDKALAVAKEVVAHYRDLADEHSERHQPNLAKALTNLWNSLAMLGRYTDALPVAEEVVAIYRDLVAQHPERYRPDLAGALSNLGIQLSQVGHIIEGLSAEQEAVLIRRQLVERYPERYKIELVSSLINLASHLGKSGYSADIIPVLGEAITMYHEIAHQYPGHHLWESIDSLERLYSALSASDRFVIDGGGRARSDGEHLNEAGGSSTTEDTP